MIAFNFYVFLDSLFKNFGKVNFKYLGQEFYNNVLDIVKEKFYPYKYMSDIEKFDRKDWQVCQARKNLQLFVR